MTVTYGLRYDVYRPPEANREGPFAYSQKFRTDKNNIAPRVGLAWDPKGDGKMTIPGHPPFFLKPQPRFVTMRGGEYLYRPSISALRIANARPIWR